jgi:MFS family permease
LVLVLLALASLGWAFSFGVGAPLASLWLRDAGCGSRLIGLNTSAYYLGVALAAPLVPLLMQWANRSCVLAGMLLDAATTAAFPWTTGPAGWFVLRLLGGVGTALSLIPMETLVNHNAPTERRARDFGLYAFSVALGIALGTVVGLPLYPVAPRLAFALGGLVTLAAMGPAVLALPTRFSPPQESAGRAALLEPSGFLGLGTAWVQGFLEGGTVAFLSLYLLTLGYTEAGASALMGGLFLGVILAQLPVGWLADRLGRLHILLGCHAVLLLGLMITPFCVQPVGLALGLFTLGACCGALYPLGLALLGERVPAGGLARANAWYLASNCAGSLSGPAVMGLVIDLFGQRAQFLTGGSAILVILGGWMVWETAGRHRGEVPLRSGNQPGQRPAA